MVNHVTALRPMRLAGVQGRGPLSFDSNIRSGSGFAAELWHRLIDELMTRGISPERVLYGVTWHADKLVPPQELHYFCGLEVKEDISGLDTLVFDGGSYFEHRCEVPASDLDQGFQDAYQVAFPASGLLPRAGQHLEIYGEDYDPDSPIARFTVLIPVE